MMIDLKSAVRPAQLFHMFFTLGLVGVGTLATLAVVATMFAPHATGVALVRFANLPAEGVTGAQAAAMVALMLVSAALWAAMFGVGRRLCQSLSDGSVDDAADAATRLSHVLLALLVWSVIGQIAGSAAASWHLGDGQRIVAVSLGTPQISLALAAFMGVFLARAFTVGAQLWRDHTEIV
ncbi:hypothetical protein RDV64_23550 (plasmid) [Acuticoccus sp. MNP-M23]|uniref:hypothetical protein n=1 Tax=Acuticoccus sp. MNP-M23 TaxID=3072793 RepID=UPI0028156DE8|nr:hypothetical protein [Acuticoccus sp. MNP-M23]WMS45313.1 hypothetical protein RDV64_23550 [Acuticoccus sp. MNP-M23]